MIKLLNAGFTRLRKNRVFLILTIFSIGFAVFAIYAQYNQMVKYGYNIDILSLILNYPTIAGIVIAVFTSLFLGVEYSDGVIRNKISIGHKRENIYLSNLIIVVVTNLFFYILFIITITAIGAPLFGWITISISELLLKLFVAFMIIVSYSSIFTFIAMLCSNKALTSIITTLLAFGLMMMGIFCLEIINSPEYIQSATLEDGETQIEKIPNPRYPSDSEKKMYQTLLDINPAGQAFQTVQGSENLKILPLYSLGILIIFTGLGLVLFRKKELK